MPSRYRPAMTDPFNDSTPGGARAEIELVWPSTQQPRPWPLHGTAPSRAIEQALQAALPAHTLMSRAGLAVAQLARAVAPHGRRAVVVAGPGNNGGDGLEAAIHLQAAGWQVAVHQVGIASDRPLPVDTQDARRRASEAGVRIEAGLPPAACLAAADLVIDALLGLGVSRPPDGALAQAIATVNDCGRLVLAVDLPSGLDADTGDLGADLPPGRCVRAHHTLSLLTLKPSLFTAHGRDHAGTVWFCSLGAMADGGPATARLNTPAAGAPQARRHTEHKGSYGSVAVLGGASGMAGAAWLAARAALHAGAGRVHVQLLDAAPTWDAGAPELMVRADLDWLAAAQDDWVTVAGCGGGSAIAGHLPGLLARIPRLVLDADALNALSREPALQAQLTQRAACGWQTVLTPHPLEAARLLASDVRAVQADRLGAAQRLADACHAVVVLKGSGSVIASPQATPWINPTGNARLGTAGTGDVLAGWIAGLWAATGSQGGDALQAARQAVYAHGEQADRWPVDTALTAGALARTPCRP